MLNLINLNCALVVVIFSNYVSCDSATFYDGCKKDSEGYCLSEEMNTKKSCTLTPQSSEGPFFLPYQPVRQDITEGHPGTPFNIHFTVKNVKNNCEPVKNALVHIWHTNAMGIYSAYSGYYPLGDPGKKQITGGHSEPTEKATFLRGIQITDEAGKATFKTIYPGWYKYRPLHIHYKVTIGQDSKHTGEIYFPDAFSDKIFKQEPYSEHKGKRVENQKDWQFVRDNGEALVMTPEWTLGGLEGSMDVVIDLGSTH